MELKIRYENEIQILTLNEEETSQLAKCLCVEIDGLDADKIEIVIQNVFDDEFNRPEYNGWHKADRHRGYSSAKEDEEGNPIDPNEPLMKDMVESWLCNSSNEERDSNIDLEELLAELRNVLKPDEFEMVVAISSGEYKPGEYAVIINDDPNNVSHRYRRALKKINKKFKK